jgi:hypothetical protein
MENPNRSLSETLAAFLWRTLPNVAARISTTAAVSLMDGTHLYELNPRLVYAAPVVFVIGVVLGWQHPTFGNEPTYTASLLAMGLLLFLGSLGTNLGVLGWLGYVIGEFFLRPTEMPYSYPYASLYPYTYLIRRRVPMLLSYVLLSTLLFCIPLVAMALGRTARQWPLPQGSRKGAAATVTIVSLAALVYLWAQSTATLIRPIFTWLGDQPTFAAIEPLQQRGWVLSLVAVSGYLLRLVLESKKAAAGVARTPFVPAKPAPGLSWLSRLPPAVRYVLSGVGTALLLSGLFATWLDFLIAAAAVTGLRFAREPVLRRIPQWVGIVSRVPVVVRLAVTGYLIYWLATQIITSVWFTASGTFRPILASVLVSMIVFLVLLPDLYRARGAQP